MNIGFYLQGFAKYGAMAERLVASANAVMPGVPVYQLTDDKCPAIPGTLVLRIPGEIPMGTRRVMHYAALDGEWCFVGADVLFLQDVRPVFDKEFDIAMADRKGTELEGSGYETVMPYNFDVAFSRSRRFWGVVLDVLKQIPERYQEWGGEQCVTCRVLDQAKFLALPRKFNYTPESKLDPLKDVAVLHLKGKKKTWFDAGVVTAGSKHGGPLMTRPG